MEAPAALHRQYPDEMTIVLQHQYWNLSVDDAGFSVTLRFGGRPERLVVPWTALRAFADPSADFAFRLQPPAEAAGEEAAQARRRREPEAPAGDPAQASPFRPGSPRPRPETTRWSTSGRSAVGRTTDAGGRRTPYQLACTSGRSFSS